MIPQCIKSTVKHCGYVMREGSLVVWESSQETLITYTALFIEARRRIEISGTSESLCGCQRNSEGLFPGGEYLSLQDLDSLRAQIRSLFTRLYM